MKLTALALCMQVGFLTGCTTPHDPARDGVWIVKPASMVRCEQTPAGVVCRSVQALRIEDVEI